MSKLEETNTLIDTITKLAEAGIPSNIQTTTVLLDIAKSLAIIADTMSGENVAADNNLAFADNPTLRSAT